MATCVELQSQLQPKALISVRCIIIKYTCEFLLPATITTTTTATSAPKTEREKIEHKIVHLFGHTHKHNTVTNAIGSPLSHFRQSKSHLRMENTPAQRNYYSIVVPNVQLGHRLLFIAFIDHHELVRVTFIFVWVY